MADDFDIEAMLEAPYKKDNNDQSQAPSQPHREPSSQVSGGGVARDSKDHGSSGRDKERRRSRSRDKDRRSSDGYNRERRGGGGRDRDRDRDHERDRRDRDRRGGGGGSGRGGSDYDRDADRRVRGDRDRRRSPPSGGGGRFGGNGGGGRYSGERGGGRSDGFERKGNFEMTPEERDARTVFVWQLSARIRPRDLEDFFSSVGHITDVRLIMDNKTRRSKGIAYVEFRDAESVQLALALTGTLLLSVPIQVQSSQAEKNRVGQPPSVLASLGPAGKAGPLKLYVGSLHHNITKDMLMGIFEPFGKIDDLRIMTDSASGQSLGYGFVTYHSAEDAKKALEQLNGFELASQPMRVGHVVDKSGGDDGGAGGLGGAASATSLDNEEMDKAGVDLGTTGRLALMAKLAEGTGMAIPAAAQSALAAHNNQQALAAGASLAAAVGRAGAGAEFNGGAARSHGQGMMGTGLVGNNMGVPPAATQCFMLSNMFEPKAAVGEAWVDEIRDDVLDECNKSGGALHIYVDKESAAGNVYVKCPSIASAAQCVNSLHGRWFSSRIITAAYIPLPNYHGLFPEASKTATLIGAQPNVSAYGW